MDIWFQLAIVLNILAVGAFGVCVATAHEVDGAQRVADGLEPLRRLAVTQGVLDLGAFLQQLGRLYPVAFLQRDFAGDEVFAHL